jgi:hypothetical protein
MIKFTPALHSRHLFSNLRANSMDQNNFQPGSFQRLAGISSSQGRRDVPVLAAGRLFAQGVRALFAITKLNNRVNVLLRACAPGASNNGAATLLFA